MQHSVQRAQILQSVGVVRSLRNGEALSSWLVLCTLSRSQPPRIPGPAKETEDSGYKGGKPSYQFCFPHHSGYEWVMSLNLRFS